MALTNKQIWERYNQLEIFEKIEIKRRLAEGIPTGSNLVTNGDFSTDTNWTKGTGWTISAGTANADTVSGATLSQDISLKNGFLYQINFQILEYAAGTLQILAGDESISEDISQNGLYSITLRALGDGILYFKGLNSFTAKLDNVSVKLIKEYEDNWYDISQYLIDKSLSSIKIGIPNNFYEFGEVKVGNARFNLLNLHGEVSDETNFNSEFKNYIRHNSLIRVIKGYVDKYTDAENPESIRSEIFQGFIDDRSAQTNDDNTETFSAKSLLSILESVTIPELGNLTKTNVNELVFEIMNRGQFTNFFNVNADNIRAGYNTTNLNLSLIDPDKNVLQILQDLAFGHSIFFVKNGEFFFQPAASTSVVQHEFLTIPERKIAVYDFNQGSQNVIEKWFWEGTSISYISENEKFGTKKTIDIAFIDNTAQRENLVEFIGKRSEIPRLNFKVDLPFFTDANIFDLIKLRRLQLLDSKGGFTLDESKLDEDILGLVIGAVKISQYDYYVIKEINHAKTNKTTLLIELINIDEVPLLLNDISDNFLALSTKLLTDFYSGNSVKIRRNNSTDTATDTGADDELDFIYRRNFIDIYLLTKFLDVNDFINDTLENDSSDTGYVTKMYDQSGNTYNVTQATKTNQLKFSLNSKLFEFDGTNDYAERTELSEIDPSKDFSIFAIIDLTDVTTGQVILQNMTSANNKFSLDILSGVIRAEMYNGITSYKSSGTITTGKHSILVLYDAVNLTLKLYIDGILQVGTTSANLPTNNGFIIGAKKGTPYSLFYNNKLDTILGFEKVLNEFDLDTLNKFMEQING